MKNILIITFIILVVLLQTLSGIYVILESTLQNSFLSLLLDYYSKKFIINISDSYVNFYYIKYILNIVYLVILFYILKILSSKFKNTIEINLSIVIILMLISISMASIYNNESFNNITGDIREANINPKDISDSQISNNKKMKEFANVICYGYGSYNKIITKKEDIIRINFNMNNDMSMNVSCEYEKDKILKISNVPLKTYTEMYEAVVIYLK